MPDKHAERITSLETKVFNQDNNITELREQKHKLELQLCEIVGTLSKISGSQVELKKQITGHINKEESVVQGIYERILAMDNELKTSFKERDEVVTNLRIGYAKLFTYAVSAFAVISVVVQMVMK